MIDNHIFFIPDSIPSITEDTAREAFLLYASSKCCYSSAPAKDGVITNMDAFNTYRVRGWHFKTKVHALKCIDFSRNDKFFCSLPFSQPFLSTAWKPSLKQDVQSGVMSLTMVKYSCTTYLKDLFLCLITAQRNGLSKFCFT